VPYRGGVWRGLFEAGAFDSVDAAPEKVRVNREHNTADAVGKVVSFNPYDPCGLIADIRIAPTPRGDDTLILASEGMLSASVGFGVHRNGEILDHGNHIRRVTRAWLDHLALVQTAAYSGAKVLAVCATRKLDAFRNDPHHGVGELPQRPRRQMALPTIEWTALTAGPRTAPDRISLRRRRSRVTLIKPSRGPAPDL